MFQEVNQIIRLVDLLGCLQRFVIEHPHVDSTEVAAEAKSEDHAHNNPSDEKHIAGPAASDEPYAGRPFYL